MKILIADDERMARVTLKSMLNDLKFSDDEIYEAGDGDNFLKLVKTYYPNIAFVDIKMPKLNGLQAIKKAKEISPNTNWIILTGYSEFDFAKEALELKVFKYLLKPLDPIELAETMNFALENYKNTLIALNVKFERDIITLKNNIKTEIKFEDIILDADFQVGVIYLDGKDSELVFLKKRKLFIELKSLAEQYLDNSIRIAMFNLAEDKIATVCAYNPKKEAESMKKIETYFHLTAKLINKFNNNKFAVTMIKTNKFNHNIDLIKHLEEIELLSPIRVLYGINYDYRVDKLKLLKKLKCNLKLCKSIINLTKYYNNQQYLYYKNTINSLKNDDNFYNILMDRGLKKNIINFIYCMLDIKVDYDISGEELLGVLTNRGDYLVKQDNKNTRYIDDVIIFIEQNYMKDIGINTIAPLLNISPNYLSSLFHKKTKKKFTDYLAEVRVARAKKLLLESDMFVKEIAEKVGYYSARYFTKVFFKYEKCYPSEYRKNFEQE